MADDMTKQEILFFTTMIANPDGARQDDIFDQIGDLAEELGWPRSFEQVPRPLEERLRDGETRGFIGLCAPLTWKVTSANVRPYTIHLVDTYLTRDEEREARESLLAKLNSASIEIKPTNKKALTA